jgi:hypothetical protein
LSDLNLFSPSKQLLSSLKVPFDDKLVIVINHFLPANGSHLFNEPTFFKLHSLSNRDYFFQLVRIKDSRVVGTLAFHEISKGFYASPGRGTFGGLNLNEKLEFQTVEKFLHTVNDFLRQQGAQTIRICCAPAGHDVSLFAVVFNILTRQGFEPTRPELNYQMQINEQTFINRIEYGNVKRIRKTKRTGFLSECISIVQLPAVHQLIAENRSHQGIEISMTYAELYQMAVCFPERIHLFATYRDASRLDMVAAAVCLSLRSDLLYVLYWGDAKGMSTFSPVAMLAETIYNFCAVQGFKLLDVGISTLHAQPNFGLINFKRNLGFTESLKLEMVWHGQASERNI